MELKLPAELNHYELVDPSSLLGKGSYGCVAAAIDKKKGDKVAIKVMANGAQRNVHGSTVRELTILKGLKHPNITKVVQTYVGNDNTYLIVERCDMDLEKLLQMRKGVPIDEKFQKIVTEQLLQGLAYLHSELIVHRDVKPQNVLVSSNSKGKGNIKICDFGMGRRIEIPLRETTREVCTLPFRAPEIILSKKVYADTPMDIWGAGAIFLQLTALRPVFSCGATEVEVLLEIFKLKGTPTTSTWPSINEYELFQNPWPKFPPKQVSSVYPNFPKEALPLLEGLLHYDPHMRMTADQALQHPWFADQS
eukprot:TRINITY_DN4600_c0_g1_i1.p1 TRINITY_DN4600_c0_g1~~TRINITY_DN4600_c0_g1_i1.p1  ORF type:complete len:307 (+),score=45.44 TRINITY_DN4600_c0_g1_i1:68-988(+)